MGDFYRTDPDDPDAPIRIDEHQGMRVGDLVAYTNPALAFGLTEPMKLTALYQFRDCRRSVVPSGVLTQAILNEGEFEVNADNLHTVLRPRNCPDGGTCHHLCGDAKPCFRVVTCGPLSGTYPGNRWPPDVTAAERELEAVLADDIRVCARCRKVLVGQDEAGWYYQQAVDDPQFPGVTFQDRVYVCHGHAHDPVAAARCARPGCDRAIIRCERRPPHGGCSSAHGWLHAYSGAHACRPGSNGPYALPPAKADQPEDEPSFAERMGITDADLAEAGLDD